MSSIEISPLIFLSYYPVAAYAVGRFELQLARTKKASEAVSRMLDCAIVGTAFSREDASFLLSDAKWNSIPWNRIISVVQKYPH